MDTCQVQILAADKTLYEGPCVSLTIPASDGERGILAHHSSMMAAIVPGTIRWRPPGQEVQLAAVSPGMVKVEANEVLVLVDSAERPDEIDEARAGLRNNRFTSGKVVSSKEIRLFFSIVFTLEYCWYWR